MVHMLNRTPEILRKINHKHLIVIPAMHIIFSVTTLNNIHPALSPPAIGAILEMQTFLLTTRSVPVVLSHWS